MTLTKNRSDREFAKFVEAPDSSVAIRTSTNIDNWAKASVTKTFTAADGSGNIGTVALFTVTGLIEAKLYARCTTSLTADGAATVEVGVTGSTASLIAQTTATDIDATNIWHDATPDSPVELDSVVTTKILNGNIFLTVATANLTAGVIDFILVYNPLSADGKVV